MAPARRSIPGSMKATARSRTFSTSLRIPQRSLFNRRWPMPSGRSPKTKPCKQSFSPRGRRRRSLPGNGEADVKRNRLAWTPAVGLIGVLAGCATITQGTTQLVQIESQPAGAICAFTREGQSLGSVTTPGSLPIKRGAQSITVICTKEDYEDARAIMNSQLEPATAVNGLVGGIVGVAVDQASGAANRYETSLKVELTPLSPADQAARAITKT